MPLVILQVPPPSRVIRSRDTPRPRPPAALRRPEAPRLVLPTPRVAPPARLLRRPLAFLVPVQAPPVLRLRLPPPLPAPRLTLVPSPAAPAPAPLAAAGEAIATSIGIQATGGTRVIMVPADLTKPGRVDITQFRVAVAAGVW
jgi:hypothetical protein